MRKAALALAVVTVLAPPAAADEIEDALSAALEAYRAGDVKLAKEEADYAATLLAQQKAEGLSSFLPEGPAGCTRRPDRDETQSMTAFGGGMMASAAYDCPGGRAEIQLMADNQMVTAMAAMFANPSMLATQGKVSRVQRAMVVATHDGEVRSLIGGRILVQISGSAPTEEKMALFEALNIRSLRAF